MPHFTIIKESPDVHSFRASSVKGIFDIPSTETKKFELDFDFEPPPIWNIGLIYGSSGSGKTTIGEHIFGAENILSSLEWSNICILDDFKPSLTVAEITDALTSVGLSSAPLWLLPYNKLSNGQKFRADMARIIMERDFVVVDEFTSVVDRIVAKSVCVAVAKYIKRTGKKVVMLSCHSDIIDWLCPDWTFDTNTLNLSCAERRRPEIKVNIYQCTYKAFKPFSHFHYMSGAINISARCYLITAFFDETEIEVGFFSSLSLVHFAKKNWQRGHRTVVKPDFQGLGIGNKMIEAVSEKIYQENNTRFCAVTSSPALVKYRLKNAHKWIMKQAPAMKRPQGGGTMKTSQGRLTCSFEYIPESLRKN